MKVIWQSSERVIPGHGVSRTNEAVELPDALAQQFIDQGQAVIEVKRADPKARAKIDEV